MNVGIKKDKFDTVIEKSNIKPKEILDKSNAKKNNAYFIVKRTIDILASFAALIVLSPILLIVILAIRCESEGDAIFSQERVGRYGKVFKMYKFRSMVVNAEEFRDKLEKHNEMDGPMFKIKDDPRVTKVGKFIRKASLDELPQLVNVLKGEMTLVGPRPSLPEEVEEFEEWMRARLEVTPGLTCYWQVSGRNDICFEEWMKLDVKYVKERSTWLDIKLIFKTFGVLFGDEHAS